MSETTTLKVSGMYCPSCKALIEMDLKKQEGINSAEVNLDAGEALVQFDPSVISIEKIKNIIEALGYEVSDWQ